MIYIKSITLLYAFILMLQLLCSPAWADEEDDDECSSDGHGDNFVDPDENGNNVDAGLCRNFQHLRDTIDRDTLNELIETHYQCNSKFRRAMRFYNSRRFQKTAQQLNDTTAFGTLLEQLRLAGVDTKDIQSVDSIFNCVMLPVPVSQGKCDCAAVKGHSFIADLLDAMPEDEVHDYNVKAMQTNANFRQFVKTLLSPKFQELLQNSLVQHDALKPMRTLRNNCWNVQELLNGVMTIFSW